MVHILLISLLFFSLSLLSCGREEATERRIRGPKSGQSGSRTGPSRVREGPPGQDEDVSQQSPQDPSTTGQTQVSAKKESLVFPVSFVNSGHKTLVLRKPNPEEPEVSIFAKPKPIPMALIAGLSGKISIISEGKYYTVSISSTTDNMTLHFKELLIKHTDFIVSDGTTLNQRQQWATTKKPFIFYITKDGNLLNLCVIDSKKINIVKKYSDPQTCEK